MKHLFLVIAFFISNSAFAVDMKPGLWKTSNEIIVDGKPLDIQKKIDQALAMIPEAQRAQFLKVIEKQMGGSGLLSGMTGKSMCVTKEMADDPLSFMNKQKDCKSTAIKDDKSRKVFKVKCDNGANGILTWDIANAKSYKGQFVGESDKKEKIEINFNGSYLSEKCKS